MSDRNRGFSFIDKIIRLIVLASMAVSCGASNAGEDRSFNGHAQVVIARIDSILINEGYCINSSDCRKKKYIFVNPRSDGFDLHVYGVSEHTLINRIVIVCLEERLVEHFNFSIRFYSVTKDQELSRSIWDKPSYSEFTYKRESK